VKPASAITASTLARVSSRTKGELLMTRLTVFLDTPARRATSLMVAGLPEERLESVTPYVPLIERCA